MVLFQFNKIGLGITSSLPPLFVTEGLGGNVADVGMAQRSLRHPQVLPAPGAWHPNPAHGVQRERSAVHHILALQALSDLGWAGVAVTVLALGLIRRSAPADVASHL